MGMAVQPGGTPYWVGNHRYGKRFGGKNYGDIPDEIYDEKKENEVEKNIEYILIEKLDSEGVLTDKQKALLKNTLKEQIKRYSKAIVRQAEDEVDFDFNIESSEYEELKIQYYQKLSEKAKSIAIEEYDISNSFDVEKAIKREKEILERVKEGQLTKEMAKKMLSEPILFESKNERAVKYLRQSRKERNEEEMER